MSELPEGISGATPPEPRPSASGIVLCDSPDGRPSVLLGRRSRRSRFMPGHLAFPGGVLEPADRPGERHALARCVSREVAEETGLEVPAEDWIAAGVRITPPIFPVRFDTEFFVTRKPRGWAAPHSLPSPEEIEELQFVEPAVAIRDWERGACKLPPPVLPILRSLAEEGPRELQRIAERLTAVNAREQRAPRIEFMPGVWMLPVASATLPPATHTNVWMPGTTRFVVIDPGSSDLGELTGLEQVIDRRRALGHEPLAVLLTHGHGDHAAGAALLAQSLSVPLRAHAAALDAAGLTGDGIPIEPDETIDLDGRPLRAILTPGHAPGHLAFHLPEQRTIVAGDLLSGISTILIDPVHGDMQVYVESLRRVQALDCRMLLPGHGPPLPAKALDRLIVHRLERERKIEGLVGPGSTLAGIARQAYDDLPRMPAALIECQTLSHLIHLERRGRVRRVNEGDDEWASPEGRP